MEVYEKVFKEYRKGSFEKRLNLYIKHRDLRKEFNEIELEDNLPVSKAVKDKKEKGERYMIFRRLKWGGTLFD